MADERQRDLDRDAAAGDDPQAEERAARERCRAGKHEWSEWETAGRFLRDDAQRTLGPRRAIEFGYIEREVQSRVCWWCFGTESRRFRPEDPEPIPPMCDHGSCIRRQGHDGQHLEPINFNAELLETVAHVASTTGMSMADAAQAAATLAGRPRRTCRARIPGGGFCVLDEDHLRTGSRVQCQGPY